MSEPTTSNTNSQEPTYAHSTIQESMDPEAHYDKLYSVVLQDPQVNASPALLYGVMRGLSRKSGVVNASNAYLAECSGLSERSIQRAVSVLRDRGLIVVGLQDSPKGTMRTITFPPLLTIYGEGRQNGRGDNLASQGRQNGVPPTGVNLASNDTLTKRSNDNDTSSLRSSVAHEERGGRGGSLDDNAPLDKTPMAQKNLGATETPARDGVSNFQKRPQSEEQHPYWQAPRRKAKFDFLYDNYPKMSPVIQAMVAMRLAITEDEMDSDDFMNRVWHGLQWWKEKWQKEGTEERFIPAMGRWFERRQWEQANVNPDTLAGASNGS